MGPLKDDFRNEHKLESSSPITLHSLSTETNITTLSLSASVSSLPDHFDRLPNLLHLDLSCNNLLSLPSSVAKLNKLVFIDLSHNKFSIVPNCFFTGLQLVKQINLSHNELKYFNLQPLCLPTLKIISLKHNQLISPPMWLFRVAPSSLEEVDLSFNFSLITSFDSRSIEDDSNMVCSRVSKLYVMNCGLCEKSANFIDYFNNLKLLHIGNEEIKDFSNRNIFLSNSFQEFPMNYSILPQSLEELVIKNTSLSSINERVFSFLNLKVLNLENNSLSWIPDAFCLLKSLEVLKASSCGLFLIPEEFGKLSSIQELYLDKNSLPSLPTSFQDLNKLKILDLYRNNFVEMPDLSGLNLRALDIWSNRFEPPQEIKMHYGSVAYETLVRALRCRDANEYENRLNSKVDKDPMERLCSSKEETDHYESSSSEENPCETHIVNEEYVPEEEEDEWDIGLNDDNFDPHWAEKLHGPPSASDEMPDYEEVPWFLREERHFFCPYKKRQQFWGKRRIFHHEEGQFDDC